MVTNDMSFISRIFVHDTYAYYNLGHMAFLKRNIPSVLVIIIMMITVVCRETFQVFQGVLGSPHSISESDTQVFQLEFPRIPADTFIIKPQFFQSNWIEKLSFVVISPPVYIVTQFPVVKPTNMIMDYLY